ncbi:hypothetical protein H4219_001215 [Mycoemilia scoparia]|uniref:RNA-binding S4 domain-containing protein n=1 Tax=Mycoemilia scoparia TaxID=417184 RepID=A0A9W8A0X0_9FUNG|nr:hypothetical protein H4219_001215 [Mycoemilia scoparia]
MTGRSKAHHKLARQVVRMSWNKLNLFTLANKKNFDIESNKTLFQRMWQAKRDTRGYHGPQIKERQWLRMFNPKLPTLNVKIGKNTRAHPNTASLTFSDMERRVDFIVFRSHFASSIWNARQLVLHGKVYLNGKKFRHPSHLVKDGDIVSVKPESVATLSKPEGGGQELKFTPRPYQQAFMFLPEYLEVDYNTCSTVFLRSPLTQPGKTELPSPFSPETHALAYKFYLRRGRSKY